MAAENPRYLHPQYHRKLNSYVCEPIARPYERGDAKVAITPWTQNGHSKKPEYLSWLLTNQVLFYRLGKFLQRPDQIVEITEHNAGPDIIHKLQTSRMFHYIIHNMRHKISEIMHPASHPFWNHYHDTLIIPVVFPFTPEKDFYCMKNRSTATVPTYYFKSKN